MNIIKRFRARRECAKLGHLWKFAGSSLGGDWIRCTRCNKLDEYILGIHEPEGYSWL